MDDDEEMHVEGRLCRSMVANDTSDRTRLIMVLGCRMGVDVATIVGVGGESAADDDDEDGEDERGDKVAEPLRVRPIGGRPDDAGEELKPPMLLLRQRLLLLSSPPPPPVAEGHCSDGSAVPRGDSALS